MNTRAYVIGFIQNTHERGRVSIDREELMRRAVADQYDPFAVCATIHNLVSDGVVLAFPVGDTVTYRHKDFSEE
ncbi:hypothetical protein ACFLQN_04520 [Candidatus Aenigmatarchaeota archaeon]